MIKTNRFNLLFRKEKEMENISDLTLGSLWGIVIKALLASSLAVSITLFGLGIVVFLGTLFFGGELNSAVINIKETWSILPELLAVAGWIYIYHDRCIKA